MRLMHSPAFQIRDFRILLASRWMQTFALQFQAVIVSWQVYQLKGVAILLGLIGLSEAIPAILCSFFAGHFVDILRPAKIFQISTFINALNAAFIFVCIGPWLETSAEFKIIILFFGVFISGITRSFISPSQFSLIPKIVPREHIPSAAAFNSMAFMLAQILGPALGGLVYGFAGANIAFAIPLIFTSLAVVTSQFFSSEIKNFRSQTHKDKEPVFKSIKSGLKFLFEHKVLLSTMSLDMFSVLFGGAVAVLPIFADQIFHVGSVGLGILRAAPAIGSVLISLYFGFRPMKIISGDRLLAVIGGFGVCMVLFGLVSNFYIALILLFFSGMFDGINMIIRGTLTQLLTPENMRGRVSSLSTVFITSSNEIGAFESGLAAQFMGLVPSVVFGGVMTLFIVLTVLTRVPELRRTRIIPNVV